MTVGAGVIKLYRLMLKLCVVNILEPREIAVVGSSRNEL